MGTLATTLSMPIRIDYDLMSSRDSGFKETLEPGKGYIIAFNRLQEAKLLLYR